MQPLLQINTKKLQFWSMCFVLETRKKDDTEYPLHHSTFVKMGDPPSTSIYTTIYASFQQTLDTEMKRLKSTGKQAEALFEEDEEKLWQAKVLGDHSPQALLNTMKYMNGVYFALGSGAKYL